MLWELFQYAVTPCDSSVRRLGGLTEFIGIRARYGRCRDVWQPHLDRCQKKILEATERASNRGTALILGSGWLLDVPLEELSRRFQRVILADWIHPWAVRRRAKRCGNVECYSVDLSGAAISTLEWGGGDFPKLQPVLLPQGDFVASVNVMTQLPILVKDWIEKKQIVGGDSQLFQDQMKSWARLIIEQHWNAVRTIAPVGCLMTDLEELTMDCDGKVLEHYDPLEGFVVPSPDETWDWELSPHGEIDSKQRILHRVGLWNWTSSEKSTL